MGFAIGSRLDALTTWFAQVGWTKLEKLVLVLLTCFIILWAVNLVARAVRKAVDDGNDGVTTDAERRAETLGSVLKNAARVLVAVFFVLVTLQEFGVNIQPLLAGSAVAGVALGFGAQTLVKDIIAGFFLLLENQFGVGDIISVDSQHSGTVERMTLRVTQIRDLEGKAHYLPNGSISQVVVMSKDFARALVDVEISLDQDIDRVSDLLRLLGRDLMADMPQRRPGAHGREGRRGHERHGLHHPHPHQDRPRPPVGGGPGAAQAHRHPLPAGGHHHASAPPGHLDEAGASLIAPVTGVTGTVMPRGASQSGVESLVADRVSLQRGWTASGSRTTIGRNPACLPFRPTSRMSMRLGGLHHG